MLKLICFLALICASAAASIGSADTTTEKKEVIPVLKYETDKKPDGSFHFMYEGGDRSFREESGVIENAGTDDEALEVSGSYRYIDADGHEVEVHYTAGKNGFVPVGTHILPEITALAKSAADLPNTSDDDAKEAHDNARKARSGLLDNLVKVVEEKGIATLPEHLEKTEEKKAEEEKKPEEEKVEEMKAEEKKEEPKKEEVKQEETKKDEEKKPEEAKKDEANESEVAKVEEKKS